MKIMECTPNKRNRPKITRQLSGSVSLPFIFIIILSALIVMMAVLVAIKGDENQSLWPAFGSRTPYLSTFDSSSSNSNANPGTAFSPSPTPNTLCRRTDYFDPNRNLDMKYIPGQVGISFKSDVTEQEARAIVGRIPNAAINQLFPADTVYLITVVDKTPGYYKELLVKQGVSDVTTQVYTRDDKPENVLEIHTSRSKEAINKIETLMTQNRPGLQFQGTYDLPVRVSVTVPEGQEDTLLGQLEKNCRISQAYRQVQF